MSITIRRAIAGDEAAMLHIKNALSLKTADCKTVRGGFLLGTDEATYRQYIEDAICFVAEDDGKVVGFAIIFPDAMVRTSDVWERRGEANWFIDITAWETKQLAYFEQFAFLSGYRRAAVVLAYNIIKHVFDTGADALFTTTVHAPVLNLAPLPFIAAAYGIKAGNINEVYPVVGHINSDIYLIEPAGFRSGVLHHPLRPFFEANMLQLQ